MFSGNKDSKSSFVKNAQLERQQRQDAKKKEKAVVKIQAVVRMFICKKKYHNKIRDDFDKFFNAQNDQIVPVTALSSFTYARRLMLIYNPSVDNERFLKLCKTIIVSLDSGREPKFWYMSILLIKEWTGIWIKHLKEILVMCSNRLKNVKSRSGFKDSPIYLSMLIRFTDCSNWKILQIKGGENIRPIMQQLCVSVVSELTMKGLLASLQEYLFVSLNRNETSLNKLSVTAVTTLIMRCFKPMPKVAATHLAFTSTFLTLPGYIHHLKKLSEEGVKLLDDYGVLENTLSTLHNYDNMAAVFKTTGINEGVCLIGNLVTLCSLNIKTFKRMKDKAKTVLTGLSKHCQSLTGKGHGNTKWHPVFGWCSVGNNSRSVTEAVPHILAQLRLLWHQPLVGYFFENLPSLSESEAIISTPDSESKGGMLRRALMKTFRRSDAGVVDLNEPLVIDICMTCDLYQTLTNTLTQLRLEIVAGLSLQEEILVRLWRFIYSLGPGAGMKSILNYVNGDSGCLPAPLASLLTLFCECTSQLVPILDDEEVYVKQKPFSSSDLVKLASFLNSLVFKLIWNNVGASQDSDGQDKATTGTKKSLDDPVKNLALRLLHILHDRDCRRSFMPPNQWLIKELKMSTFHNELKEKTERSRCILQNMPHVLPHMERVKIFHKWVESDKLSLGIDKEFSRATAVVNIKRSRLLEDGYEQLNRFSGSNLKGIIRVKFVNEQGLDEAGIDQDGVFKEFLEDVIAEAFNPQLNLFKMTTGGDEQKLYPSSTSFIHENHLNLFHFVGKILGKAVYEGILVDVPFAPFFLNKMLTHRQSLLYSSIDELPSLDPDMYKNLNYIKNYDGDVSELELVFAYDEDILGQMVTHDLKPGGRVIPVTNANKLSYIHLMAQFRLNTQIKEQTAAFIQGFLSVISLEWLSIFSGPELQRLISGDTGALDLSDLKNHTRYYGGYHIGHQTINWLWDIVINEFSVAEKKLFLKFVTSCSNPPLLGFSHLEPQFSVRFVDCTEDEDTGDTVGSVVRGLLGVRKRGSSSSSSAARLPTASTCFNLLKLPSYKKKSILREKLRYAIKSGAGFELS